MNTKELQEAVENLKSILCNSDGQVVISGSDQDINILQNAIDNICVFQEDIIKLQGIMPIEMKKEIIVRQNNNSKYLIGATYNPYLPDSKENDCYRHGYNDARNLCIKALAGRVSVEKIIEIVKTKLLNIPIGGDWDRTRAIYVNEKVCENIAQAIHDEILGKGE